MAHRFFNETGNAVCEAIEGLIASYPHLSRLDGFPEVVSRLTDNKAADRSVLSSPRC